MIQLTKLNDTRIVVNLLQIECIEEIPESKIIMTNGIYHIVKESVDDIIQKSIDYIRKTRRSDETGR